MTRFFIFDFVFMITYCIKTGLPLREVMLQKQKNDCYFKQLHRRNFLIFSQPFVRIGAKTLDRSMCK